MTHKDNELVTELSKQLDDILWYPGLGQEEAFNNMKDRVIELFTTTLQQREREARLEELDRLQQNAGYGEYTASEYKMAIDLRIKALSNTDKENL
jgi:hypothetical protein